METLGKLETKTQGSQVLKSGGAGTREPQFGCSCPRQRGLAEKVYFNRKLVAHIALLLIALNYACRLLRLILKWWRTTFGSPRIIKFPCPRSARFEVIPASCRPTPRQSFFHRNLAWGINYQGLNLIVPQPNH